MTRRVAGTLVLVLSCFAGVVLGQSKDAAHPAPLGPGVNKGNVVNFDGPQYWYFDAGPGHLDIRIAFHEMGMLGNPFRQNLVVDMFNPAGKSVWHGVITSQGKTAETKTYGDFPDHHRVKLKVSAQDGLVRMGGYYEIEITGAVSFDGKAGATAGVKAEQSDSLVHPSGPLVKSGGGPLVTSSSGPLVKSGGGPLVTSGGGPLVKSSGPLVYPGKPLIVQETPHTLRILLAADVLFDFGKAEIRPDAEVTLRQAATKMKFAKAQGTTLIEGYTDAKGSAGLNQKLSERRAEAVDRWLVTNAGFAAGGMSAKGYGAARPVAPNVNQDGSDDPAGRQLNRRVEIVVSK